MAVALVTGGAATSMSGMTWMQRLRRLGHRMPQARCVWWATPGES
jgi:hypothetical protein